MIEVEGPDGTVIEFPDNTAPETIKGVMAKHYGGPQMGTGEDVLRSGISGVGEGSIGLAGTLGDVQSILSTGAGWASEKTGIGDPEFMRQSMRRVGGSYYPSSDEITKTAEGAGVQFHEPQTRAGKYARTAGQFVPSMIGGPGSAGMRVASGAGAALASETAGQATEGSAAEPYARFAAALIGGGVPALKGMGSKPKLPSTQDLRHSADAAYKAAENSGVTIPAQAYTQILDRIGQIAVDEGAGTRLTPNVQKAMAQLVEFEGRDLSVKEIDLMRKNLKLSIDKMKPEEARIINKMVAEFDDMVEQIAPTQLADARKKYSTFKKASELDELERRAELSANTINQSGLENARRTEYRNFAKNAKKMGRLRPDERSAMEQVAKGGGAANAVRFVGKAAPRGVVSMLPALIGSTVGGPTGMALGLGLPIAGEMGRYAATKFGERNIRLAQELIRTGSNKGSTEQKRKQIEAIARALLQGQGTSSATSP